MHDDATVAGAPRVPDPDRTLTISDANARENEARHLPANIGHYRIIRLLGEGGMGAVYEAEQDRPRRRVALKVIKSAWASPELLRRFEQEFQTLGRLHHPGIAQIYEAGAPTLVSVHSRTSPWRSSTASL
ncbi:MAG TPA: protein kinase [Dongiaceae bacterium]|nr:protein kinase [Dongiaceae bacterium]